jgi:hypothetical protein
MAEESYSEVTTQSWGSRIGGSFKGIVGGLILVALAVWLLFWNEGRSVRRERALTEGAGVVVSVASGAVDPVNEGKLVHLSGLAETFDVLRDDTFGVALSAVHLERKVEMYQWRENESSNTEKKLGGSTETTSTFTYEKAWSSSVNNSNNFKVPEGHENPNQMPYQRSKSSAANVSVGAFSMSSGLISSMTRSEPLPIESMDGLPSELRWKARLSNGGIYIGRSPGSPEVGDMRVSFEVVRPATVSIVARQGGNSLGPYTTSGGGSIQLLSYGAVAAEGMFVAAKKANRLMTWVLRVLGFLMIAMGLKRIFRPLSVLADVVPAIGRVVAASSGFVAYLLAAFIWLIVVAIAWLYHRPVLAVVLLLLAGGVLVGSGIAIAKVIKRNKEAPVAA